MLGSALLFAPFVLLLLLAAGWDLASFTIPNFIPAILLIAFLVFAISVQMAPGVALSHAAAGGLGLLASFGLFALGYIGGGDAKLFACIAVWLGLNDLPEYVLIASLFGGGLTLVLLAMRRYPLPAFAAGREWIARLHAPSSGIPYGVALSAGALAVLQHTQIFQAVAR